MSAKQHTFFFPDQTIPQGIGLLNCGHSLETSQAYRWDGMHRGLGVMYVWQYTLSGCGSILVDGMHYPLPPGKAFFVRVPHEHVYYLPEDSASWEFLYITLYGSEMERLGTEFIRRYGNIFQYSGYSRTVAFAKEMIRESLSRNPDDCYRVSLSAYEFLLQLFREQESSKPGHEAYLLDKVNAFLQGRLAEPVSIDSLALACGYSRSHFSRKFHASVGKTPQEYIRDLKMHFAMRLLQMEQKSIKVTAANAGFDDVSYFCRVFHRQFGMTPEQFRSGSIGKKKTTSPVKGL